jgi:hypothetical protein
MWMSFIDRVRYPKFYAYLRYDLPDVAKVSSIRRAFMRYGQLDRASLERALKWNEEPKCDVTAVSGGDYGEYDWGAGTNVIKVDDDLVDEFEAGRDWVHTKSGAKVHLAGVTVLHELMHWADDRDGIDQGPTEEGEAFERMVYGKVLG